MQETKARPLEEIERRRKAKGIGQKDLLVDERIWRYWIEGKRNLSRDTTLSLLTDEKQGLGLKKVAEVNKYLAMTPHGDPVSREEIITYRLRSICLESTGVANVTDIFDRRAGMVTVLYSQAERRGRIEELLRAADEAAKTLIEEFPIAVIGIDKSGRVQIWNTAAENMFGGKSEEVLDGPMPFAVSDIAEPIAARLKGKIGSFIDVCIWLSRAE